MNSEANTVLIVGSVTYLSTASFTTGVIMAVDIEEVI